MNKFDLWLLEWKLKWWEFKNKQARKKYCNKGYHKLTKQTHTWFTPGKRNQSVEYIKCLHCNYLFFATKKQKDLYLQKEGTAKDAFSSFLKSLSGAKPKQLNSTGRDNKKDASASV